jgi:hypothetical protein
MKMMSARSCARLFVAPAVLAVVRAVPAVAQTPKAVTESKRAEKPWMPPHTPWGDPDLQGTYTNSDESGIPMQRPPEFAGKRVEDVGPAELAKLIERRREQQRQTALTIGGTPDNDTGAGPSHWYENYNPHNSRAWMISDPADGQIPALTDEAVKRAAAVRAARRGGDGYFIGPFDGPEDLTLYVRCTGRAPRSSSRRATSSRRPPTAARPTT